MRNFWQALDDFCMSYPGLAVFLVALTAMYFGGMAFGASMVYMVMR